MIVRIFGKKDCDACKNAKRKFEFFFEKWGLTEEIPIEFYDMDTIEGLAEGAIYDVSNVPTTILEKDNIEITRWEGKVPVSPDFSEYFKGIENI
jgi:glutaredoxin